MISEEETQQKDSKLIIQIFSKIKIKEYVSKIIYIL
jgi:hypothetical protein